MADKIERWITMNGNHIPIFEGETSKQAIEKFTKNQKRANDDEDKKARQIEENQKQANEKNASTEEYKFKDGDTPKVLDDGASYRVKQISSAEGKDKDYGYMSGKEAKEIIKGFHYEELFPGEGMWYKNGVKYAYDIVKRSN